MRAMLNDPSLRKPQGALRGWFDERDPRGGRLKALVMLTHPGPSLLVTAVTVGAGAIAVRGVPSARLTLQLAFIMLPAQLAFGAANDAFDANLDRTTKPHKPIVRRAVSRRAAIAIAVAGVCISIGVTAWTVPRALPLTLLGIVAGLSYDLGLKRTSLSVVTWWAGFLALPLGVNLVAAVLLYLLVARVEEPIAAPEVRASPPA